MTSNVFSPPDPTVAWKARISYLNSLSKEQYTALVTKEVRLVLSQIPETKRRQSLIIQLLEARLRSGDAARVTDLWRKAQASEFQSLRETLEQLDVKYLKTMLFTYIIASERLAGPTTK